MDYIRGESRDQLFFACWDQLVSQDSWARIVDLFGDIIPYQDLDFKNSKLNKEGSLPYHPSDLFKLLLYGYRNRLRSANELAQACKINLEVRWLMRNLTPSARTINYFRSQNTKSIEKAHRYFVKLLKNWRLVDGDLLAKIRQ